jgi:hypothetical protein
MKKQISWVIRGLQVAGVALFLLASPGCDTSDPDTGSMDNYFDQNPYSSQTRDPIQPGILTLTPDSATVTFIGQKVNFRVSEGTPPYTWSVALPAIGSVSPVTGSQTIYTALDVSANSIVVHDSKGQTAAAEINGAPVIMAVTPSSVTLENNGELATFTVTGGTAPFTWTVSDEALGAMLNPPAESRSEVYRRDAPGDNSILIVDSLGNSVNAIVKQP